MQDLETGMLYVTKTSGLLYVTKTSNHKLGYMQGVLYDVLYTIPKPVLVCGDLKMLLFSGWTNHNQLNDPSAEWSV